MTMGGLLDALRGGGSDAIRQSTSLTTAYLLEQNRKFEAYMREKVAALEGRVAGQQARLTRHEMEDLNDLEWPGLEGTSSPTGMPAYAAYEEVDASGDTAPVPSVSVEPEVMSFDGFEESSDEDGEAVMSPSVVPPAVETPIASEEPPDWMAALGVSTAQPDDEPETEDEEVEPAVETVQGDTDPDVETASPYGMPRPARRSRDGLAYTQPGGDPETESEELSPTAEIAQGDADLEAADEEGDDPGLFDGPRWLAGEEGDPTVPVTGGVLGLTTILQDQSPQEEDLPVKPATKRNGDALPTATPGMDLRSTRQPPIPVAGGQSAAEAVVSSSPPQDVSMTTHQGIEDLEDEMGDWDAALPEGPAGDYA
jgi:hypothetical protein